MTGLRVQRVDGQVIDFGVMSLPNRKSKALYCESHGEDIILAYFRNDNFADTFQKQLNFLIETIKEGKVIKEDAIKALGEAK